MIAAGIYYALNKSKSQFVAFHALQSLTSQIPVTVVNAGLLFWFLRNQINELTYTNAFWAYLAFAVAMNLAYIVLSLVALTRAYRGNFFYFPVFGPWAFDLWYGKRFTAGEKAPVRPNLPPS